MTKSRPSGCSQRQFVRAVRERKIELILLAAARESYWGLPLRRYRLERQCSPENPPWLVSGSLNFACVEGFRHRENSRLNFVSDDGYALLAVSSGIKHTLGGILLNVSWARS